MKLKTLSVIILISLSISTYLLLTLDNNDVKKQLAEQSKSDDDKYIAEGIKDAYSDIEKGIFKIEIAGYPPPEIKYYAQILSDHNIKLNLAGCAVENKRRLYNHGYNQVMRFTIKAKHGPLFFAKAWKTAEQKMKAQNKNQKQY